MHSINHNSQLSNFSNYLKKDPLNSLNFHDFQFDNPNSPSIPFPYFNQYSQTFNPIDKLDPQIKLEDNPEPIGFNHFQDFLQNSIRYPFDEFKNAKIKKPTTFHLSQGYLNHLTEPTDACKQEHNKKVEQINFPKENCLHDQKLRKGADNQDNQQKQSPVKLEYQGINETPTTKKRSRKTIANQDGLFAGENNLQNLKSIAKIAYDSIKSHKVTSYQSIAYNLLTQLSKESSTLDESHSNKHDKLSVSSQGKSSKKSEIIQNMIKNQSFAQIKMMNEMQKESMHAKTQSKLPKYEYQENDDEDEQKQPSKNIKNIRRRLYDAINVMLAANVIEKRQRGFLSVKLSDSGQVKKSCFKLRENGDTLDELETKIEEKRRYIEGRKKYRQYLVTRTILMRKHIAKNKIMGQRMGKKEEKFEFPLVFANFQSPIYLEKSESKVQIDGASQVSVYAQMDLLDYLYWIQNEDMVKKEEELEEKVQKLRRQAEKEMPEMEKGHKKVKIE